MFVDFYFLLKLGSEGADMLLLGSLKKVHVKYESKKSSVALGYMGRYVVCTPEKLGCGGGVRDQFQSQVLIKRGAIKLEVNKSRILSGKEREQSSLPQSAEYILINEQVPKTFYR